VEESEREIGRRVKEGDAGRKREGERNKSKRERKRVSLEWECGRVRE
jgi:hypothetical protein